MMNRTASQYVDPLDQIWISAANQFQIKIQRDSASYVTYDGRGTIFIAHRECLDSDDCLAQLIFHELCHFLTEGEQSYFLPDWGLSVLPEEISVVKEHACQRLQAALLLPYGLKNLLAPTTEFRTYYDALPENPVSYCKDKSDPALPLSQIALGRANRAPYARILRETLELTAQLLKLMESVSTFQSSPPSLFTIAPLPKLHTSGFPLSKENSHRTCNQCVWAENQGKHTICKKSKTTKTFKTKVSPLEPACALFEESLHCQSCGACCQDAYDLVPIHRKDEIRTSKDWVNTSEGLSTMKKNPFTKSCLALQKNESLKSPNYSCYIYSKRPKTCRELSAGSRGCLIARQKMGLSI